jgi:hypothetical protein
MGIEMVIETIEEFHAELENLRAEITANAENVDAKLVAAWLDKLVISLQGLTSKLGLLDAGLDILSEK